jgi:D-serine deaminase-like pyridoxal phosphate-dependent protein
MRANSNGCRDCVSSRLSPLAEELRRRGEALAAVLDELPTPCLVADLAAVRANLRAGASAAGALGAQLRPHAKAHKCSALLHLQLAEEHTTGVTCATSAEALALARLGFDDVLVANEVVSRAGVAELAEAARSLERLVVVPKHVGSSGPPWRLGAVEGNQFQGGDPDEDSP